ncbi:MAG: STAS domain-containing protein [Candidatus Promineifilaceae bacterium]
MSVTSRELAPGLWLVAPDGRLDHSLSPDLDAVLNELLAQGQTRFIVDFSATTYINSLGLRALLTGLRRSRERGGDLVICSLSTRLRNVFETVGLDQVLQIYKTAAEAEANIR